MQRLPNGFYRVAGTPTDCVYLGVNTLMRPRPDIVVSGINAGPNLGDDVIYSGTVAAAMVYTAPGSVVGSAGAAAPQAEINRLSTIVVMARMPVICNFFFIF